MGTEAQASKAACSGSQSQSLQGFPPPLGAHLPAHPRFSLLPGANTCCPAPSHLRAFALGALWLGRLSSDSDSDIHPSGAASPPHHSAPLAPLSWAPLSSQHSTDSPGSQGAKVEQAWLREWTLEPDNLGSHPTSATFQLCDLEPVTSLLCAPVFVTHNPRK